MTSQDLYFLGLEDEFSLSCVGTQGAAKTPNAAVRQILGKPGKAWAAEFAAAVLVVIKTGVK